MVNLGNVAGVVRSVNAPLEEDGVTVKRYVLWAKPLGPVNEDGYAIGGLYNTFYWSYTLGDWVNLDTQLVSATTVLFGALTIYKKQGNELPTLEAGDGAAGWLTDSIFMKFGIYVAGAVNAVESYSNPELIEY